MPSTKEALVSLQQAIWSQHCPNLVYGCVHKRRNDVVERHAARSALAIGSFSVSSRLGHRTVFVLSFRADRGITNSVSCSHSVVSSFARPFPTSRRGSSSSSDLVPYASRFGISSLTLKCLVWPAQRIQSMQYVRHLWRHIVIVVDGLVGVRKAQAKSTPSRVEHVIHELQHADLGLGPSQRCRARFLGVQIVVVRAGLQPGIDWRHCGAGICRG